MSRQVCVKPGQSAATAERVNQSKAERCRSLQSRGRWLEVVPSRRLLTLSAGLRGVIGALKNRPDQLNCPFSFSSVVRFLEISFKTNFKDFYLPSICAQGNNVREIFLNLHLGKERLQITSGLSLGGGPSSDYVIGVLISLDVQLMKGTKG